MTKPSVMPKSKAKTAYSLLSEIATLALAEPKRMRMGMWGGVGAAKNLDAHQRPACGTVGCIGGWIDVLKPSLTHRPQSTLGLNDDQADELFYGKLCQDSGQGTLRHAERVGAHIRRFQKKYRRQLLAKKV